MTPEVSQPGGPGSSGAEKSIRSWEYSPGRPDGTGLKISGKSDGTGLKASEKLDGIGLETSGRPDRTGLKPSGRPDRLEAFWKARWDRLEDCRRDVADTMSLSTAIRFFRGLWSGFSELWITASINMGGELRADGELSWVSQHVISMELDEARSHS
ncbi:MAG: hypothetical protein ACRCT2_14880 [Plesiomonas shigelloides]